MYMKLIIIILSLFCITGCGRDLYKLPDNLEIKLNSNEVKVYDNVTIKDLISNTNIEYTNEYLTTNKVGELTYTLGFTYKDKEYMYDLKYNVIDDTPPIFISYYGSTSVYLNQDIYPCDDAVFADNYDNLPKCIIDGELDLTKAGTYNVEYLLTDSSNNETRKKLSVKVIDPNNKDKNKNNNKNNNSSSNKQNTTISKDSKNKIADVIKKYKNDNTMIGIDVSRYQGDIDYEKVKNSGVEFVIMRIGVNSAAKGNLDMDSYYEKNIVNAKNAGLKVGVYLYSSATSKDRAYEHAMWVVETLNGLELDFPIAYDWENWKWFMEYEINLHTFNECFNVFAKTVESYGYEAMLYSSKFYLENIWTNEHEYPVWLAHYTSSTNYEGDYIMWQFTSQGRVDGINGDVDLNIYYKNKN